MICLKHLIIRQIITRLSIRSLIDHQYIYGMQGKKNYEADLDVCDRVSVFIKRQETIKYVFFS